MGWQNQQVAVEPILQRQYYPRGTDLSPIDGLSWQCFPEVMAYDTGNPLRPKVTTSRLLVTYRMSRSGLLPICRQLSPLCWRC
jgi:hypothetical protein